MISFLNYKAYAFIEYNEMCIDFINTQSSLKIYATVNIPDIGSNKHTSSMKKVGYGVPNTAPFLLQNAWEFLLEKNVMY